MSGNHPAEKGYTLIEALVVVAIIGMVSIVTVPNFVVMYRSAKIKSAVRQFSSDLREARQEAVTSYRPTMVSLGTTATEKYSYWFYQWDDTLGWQPLKRGGDYPPESGVRQLEPNAQASRTVYFGAIGFADTVTADGASRADIIFEPNGAIRSAQSTIRVVTDLKVPKQEYVFTVSAAGGVKVD